ncbi:MAG: uracil-DNA glycosylase [Gammaproteobacteria bacterium]
MDSIETRRRQYLQAMGIDVWERRAAAAESSPAETPRGGVFLRSDSEPLPNVADSVQSTIMNMDWPILEQAILTCTRCPLHKTRTHAVPGVGNRKAEWLVIGEAPGADEDRQGEPFVGRAGQLLNSMLKAIGLEREAVYIANILKCRPPNNRDPLPEEAATCEPYLQRQITLLKPKIILAVGRIAAQNLLKTDTKIGALRGKRHVYPGSDIPVVVTYHPAYLMRSPQEKRKAWEDLQLACRVFKGEV